MSDLILKLQVKFLRAKRHFTPSNILKPLASARGFEVLPPVACLPTRQETAGYKMADVIGAFFTGRNRDV